MRKTTIGNLLIHNSVPPELRQHLPPVMDKKGIEAFFNAIATHAPEKYREIAQNLSHVGRDVVTATGGYSFGLKDLKASRAALQIRAELEQKLEQILDDDSVDEDTKRDRVVAAVQARQQELEDKTFSESKDEKNPFAMQIMSGARGNPTNLKSLRAGDGLYVDQRDKIIPVPVMRSYSEGLTPAQYWAASYGARRGVLDVKNATQSAGFLSKQLVQASHRLVVSDRDDELQDDNRGMPVDLSDKDNEGALLARTTGGYPRNTRLTSRILQDLRNQGLSRALVRSPTVGGPEGGVYARDVGFRERGHLPTRGDFVGIAAAQALAEKVVQGSLSSKHSGGIAGASKTVTGFPAINALAQVPKTVKGGAAHAQMDGTVDNIVDAPQGGRYLTIGGQQHYVAQGYDPLVKLGDTVEAGDVISEGLPNPADVVRHKGIGEGRRYFVQAFMQAFRNSGMSAHRRNVELLARGLIDHVELTEEMGDNVPDDRVSYTALERNWQPREGTLPMEPQYAKGRYLEKPVLHYSIGTQVKPSVIKNLQEFGINKVDVHDQPPPFQPVMTRAMANLEHDPDWMTRHLGSNLEKGTLRAAHRGQASNPLGTSYVPAMALNPTEFGQTGATAGWKPPAPEDFDDEVDLF